MDMQVMINDIDALVAADKELKALEERVKAMKDAVANKYGEGKHMGDLYAVTVTLSQRNVVAWKKVAEQAKVPAEIISANTSTTSIITVKPGV